MEKYQGQRLIITAVAVGESIKELVSGKYDVTAQKISEQIMKENGVVDAVKAIEDYVSEGK